MAFEPRWETLAVGSAHGFAVVDLKTHTVVYKRLTHGLEISTEPISPSVARESLFVLLKAPLLVLTLRT